MPNIRRTFPGEVKRRFDDDDDSDEDDGDNINSEPVRPRAGGKQLRPVQSGGGGKYFRPPTGGGADEDDSDSDSDEDEDEDEDDDQLETQPPPAPPQAPPQQVAFRGGGKQFAAPRPAGGEGKYLRPLGPAEDDSDEDDDDEDEEEEEEEQVNEPAQQPIRVAPRGGGKSLMRMAEPQQDEESSSEEEDDDEEEEEDNQLDTQPPQVEAPVPAPAPVQQQPVRVVPRGGGKMMSLLRPPPGDEDDSDEDEEEEEDDEEEEEEVPAPLPPTGGGKQPQQPEPEEAPKPSSSIHPTKPKETPVHQPTGGKQFRRSPDEEEEESDEDEDFEEVEQEEPKKRAPPAPKPTQRPMQGGKILRPPAQDEEEEDSDEEEEEEEEAKNKVAPPAEPVAPAKDVPEPPAEKADEKPVAPAGGDMLRRSKKEESSSEEEEDEPEEEEFDVDEEDEDFGDDDDDDDYEEDEGKKSKSKKKKPAPKPKAKKDASKKDAAPASRPKRAAASKKKIIEEDEEIFGDDDISSDDDGEEDVELDENNTEALIKDDADRKYLDSLPELERERILGERFEKLKEQVDMRKAMRQAKKAKADASKKAKGGKEGPDETVGDEELARKLAGAGKRESVRDKDVTGAKGKKAAALAALKKNRKVSKPGDSDSENFADDSDEDSDGDFEAPWQNATEENKESTVTRLGENEAESSEEEGAASGKKLTNEVDGDPSVSAATLEDYQKVTIPRRRLARWCNEPFFKAAVLECFVRLFIGEDDNGEKVYRLCEIVDVKLGTLTYKFPVANRGDKPISTSQKLTLKFGNSEKDFPMNLVSDAPPTELDVQKYVTAQKNLRQEILTKRRANKLRRVQDDLVNNYTYTNEDIERNLEKQKKLGKTVGNLGAEQTKAAIAVRAARDALEEAERKLNASKLQLMEAGEKEVHTLNKELKDNGEAVQQAKKVLSEKLAAEHGVQQIVDDYKRKLKARSRDRNWAKVNKRAVEMNQRADRDAHKEHAAVAQDTSFNPYARRKVKPKILWKVGQQPEGAVKEEAKEEVQKEPQPTPIEIDKAETVPTLAEDDDAAAPPALAQETAASDSAHQFNIDEEALAKDSNAALDLGGNGRTKRKRRRVGLSLDEYLERKANGTL